MGKGNKVAKKRNNSTRNKECLNDKWPKTSVIFLRFFKKPVVAGTRNAAAFVAA